ncbi:CSC1-like protein At3g21620 [Aspergillus awamori]|uniref:CSC1-like protein At3g21620 n=1 Tax=Aspergillus awamori TaxID=105351 RepID=A0A401L7X1_ASPAW|nr:CSC1-like protein At3g21620 [Aspergillus awamori]
MSKTIANNPWLEYFKAGAFDDPQDWSESHPEANKNICGKSSESPPTKDTAIATAEDIIQIKLDIASALVLEVERTAVNVSEVLETSALDENIVLLEKVVIAVGVLCCLQKLLVAMPEASSMLDSALLMVKVGVLELKYLAELFIPVLPVMVPGERFVEDVESTTGIVVEGDSDACRTFITTANLIVNTAMKISTINENVAHAAGKAQRDRGLSFQSFLLTVLVYGSVLILSFKCFVDDDSIFVRKYGLDSYLFLRLLRTALRLFFPTALLVVPVLLPVNYTSGSQSTSGLDRFSIANVTNGEDYRYWITALIAILVHMHLCYVLIREFKFIVRIRQAHLHRYSRLQEVTTVLVTELPPDLCNRELLARLYSRFNEGTTEVILPGEAVHAARKSELDKLLKKRDDLARDNAIQRPQLLISDLKGWIQVIISSAYLRWQVISDYLLQAIQDEGTYA